MALGTPTPFKLGYGLEAVSLLPGPPRGGDTITSPAPSAVLKIKCGPDGSHSGALFKNFYNHSIFKFKMPLLISKFSHEKWKTVTLTRIGR